MKEYSILQQIGEGRPFRTLSYDTFEECERSLYIMLERFEGRTRKNYYVDNDFFNNNTDISARYYYCIEEREVGNWSRFKKVDKNYEYENDNIINFRKVRN